MLVRMSVEFDAPQEKVWPYLGEPEKAKQWFTLLEVYEWTREEQGGLGSTFSCEERVGNTFYHLHCKTTEWTENSVFGYEMTEGDFSRARPNAGRSRRRVPEAVSHSPTISNSSTVHSAR